LRIQGRETNVSTDSYAVRLQIPAKAEYITLCRLALAGLSTLVELSEETVADLKLALTEACSNSVRHAYDNGHGGTVDIVYELHPDRMVIEVSDEGRGFIADSARSEPEELTEAGLGIEIIRALSDDLQMSESSGGQGSRLRMVKLLSAP
jgi:serine/threonine-protein kinase RsbW